MEHCTDNELGANSEQGTIDDNDVDTNEHNHSLWRRRCVYLAPVGENGECNWQDDCSLQLELTTSNIMRFPLLPNLALLGERKRIDAFVMGNARIADFYSFLRTRTENNKDACDEIHSWKVEDQESQNHEASDVLNGAFDFVGFNNGTEGDVVSDVVDTSLEAHPLQDHRVIQRHDKQGMLRALDAVLGGIEDQSLGHGQDGNDIVASMRKGSEQIAVMLMFPVGKDSEAAYFCCWDFEDGTAKWRASRFLLRIVGVMLLMGYH